MTTTVEPPVEQATETPAEQPAGPKFYTVNDTGWLADRRIPADYVFEEMPLSDHPRQSSVNPDRVYLYVGEADIASGMANGTSKSKRLYIYKSPGQVTEHPGPSTVQARRLAVLAEVADLDREALLDKYAKEAERWQNSYTALWRYADANGYCPQFDEIMEPLGWPRRPKRYSIYISAPQRVTMNREWLINNLSGYTFPDEVPTIETTKMVQANFRSEPMQTKPVRDQNAIEALGEAQVRACFLNYYGSSFDMDTVDLSAAIITRVGS